MPSQFYFVAGGRKLPVAHVTVLKTLDSPIALFEEAIRKTQDGLPNPSSTVAEVKTLDFEETRRSRSGFLHYILDVFGTAR